MVLEARRLAIASATVSSANHAFASPELPAPLAPPADPLRVASPEERGRLDLDQRLVAGGISLYPASADCSRLAAGLIPKAAINAGIDASTVPRCGSSGSSLLRAHSGPTRAMAVAVGWPWKIPPPVSWKECAGSATPSQCLIGKGASSSSHK